MARGGRRLGAGRPKGAKSSRTIRAIALLASVEQQFQAHDYDPLREMILLVKKEILAETDVIRFDLHYKLAKKFYADVQAVKISGDAEAPLQIVVNRTSYIDYVGQQQVTNGTGTTHTPTV